jgi:hypothetical protein
VADVQERERRFDNVALAAALAVVLGGGACGPPPSLLAEAEVRGEVVRVRLFPPTGVEVTVSEQSRTMGNERELTFYVALERFEPGYNRLRVRSDQGTATVAFTVPEGVGRPFLQLHECEPGDGNGYAYVDFRGPFGLVSRCRPQNDGYVRVRASANPTARVVVAGGELEVGKDGELLVRWDSGHAFLDVPVAQAVAGVRETRVVVLPVRVEKDGFEPLSSSLEVEVDVALALRDLLASFTARSPLFEAVPSPTDPGPSAVVFESASMSYLRVVGPPGLVRDLDALVRVEGVSPSRSVGECGPYELPGGGLFSAPRVEEDVEVVAWDVRTGHPLASETFSASGAPCPQVAWMTGERPNAVRVRPPDEVIDGWVRERVLGL